MTLAKNLSCCCPAPQPLPWSLDSCWHFAVPAPAPYLDPVFQKSRQERCHLCQCRDQHLERQRCAETDLWDVTSSCLDEAMLQSNSLRNGLTGSQSSPKRNQTWNVAELYRLLPGLCLLILPACQRAFQTKSVPIGFCPNFPLFLQVNKVDSSV